MRLHVIAELFQRGVQKLNRKCDKDSAHEERIVLEVVSQQRRRRQGKDECPELLTECSFRPRDLEAPYGVLEGSNKSIHRRQCREFQSRARRAPGSTSRGRACEAAIHPSAKAASMSGSVLPTTIASVIALPLAAEQVGQPGSVRPGTFFTGRALASPRRWEPPSLRMCQTGFQYAPVARL